MRVAVIGGAGYIGAHILKELEKTDHEVMVFDNFSNGQRENITAPYVEGDIRNKEQLGSFFDSFEPQVIIHMAALKAVGRSMEDATDFSDVNITGAINILNAMVAHDVKHIIFSSSAAVYGEPQYNPIDEAHPTVPINYYGYTKLAVENLMSWYDQVHGIKHVSLRYFNAAGYDPSIAKPEKDPSNLLPIIMEAVTNRRQEVMIFGTDYETEDGSCVRDYIHVQDLATAHVKAIDFLKKNNRSETLNLGTGTGISVKECIAAAEKLGSFRVIHAPRRPGDPASHYTDATKAQSLLDWHPVSSDLDTILKSMLMVYRKA